MLASIGMIVGLIFGLKLFAIHLDETGELQDEFSETYFLDPAVFKKLIPPSAVKRRGQLVFKGAIVFILLGVAVYFCSSWISSDDSGTGGRIFMAFMVSAMTIWVLLGILALFSNRRIEKRLVEIRPFTDYKRRHVTKGLRIAYAGFWICYLVYFVGKISFEDLTIGKVLLFSLAVIGSLGTFQHTWICSNGIRTGLCFATWDQIEWCRWYPDRTGLLLGFKPSCRLGSWALIPLPEEIRNSCVPILEANLADQKIASVAEVLGLKIPEQAFDSSLPSETETHTSIN